MKTTVIDNATVVDGGEWQAFVLPDQTIFVCGGVVVAQCWANATGRKLKHVEVPEVLAEAIARHVGATRWPEGEKP